MLDRAQGCLLGQLVGDSLGSQVEFLSEKEISRKYPLGVRDLQDGGTWNLIAGQPTDDSEMALLLARMLVNNKSYDPDEAFKAYQFWLHSGAFDVGNTIGSALRGHLIPESEANGAMMRASPLGIFSALRAPDQGTAMARADAALTHPNRICIETNALYVRAIAEAVRSKTAPQDLYDKVSAWSVEMNCHQNIRNWIALAATELPASFERNQGWVRLAFSNALYRLLHAHSFEEALVETVGAGGDTDTNAAITGSLLGAVYGRSAIPARWVKAILNCRPDIQQPGVHRPRPLVFWPVDALELARALLLGSAADSL